MPVCAGSQPFRRTPFSSGDLVFRVGLCLKSAAWERIKWLWVFSEVKIFIFPSALLVDY